MTAPAATAPASPGTEPPRRASRRPALIALVTVVVLVVIAAAYHLSAYAAYRRSFATSATLDSRTSSAQLAAHLEPWNRQFAERATVMAEWRHGATYVSQGAYLPAMLLLADAYKHDVGDKQLLALFQDAQTELTIHSNYKAHVQHAHEGPGGTLRPQDLLR